MATKSPKASTAVEYLVTGMEPSQDNAELMVRLNALGDEGWRLLFLAGFEGAPKSMRAWFVRDK